MPLNGHIANREVIGMKSEHLFVAINFRSELIASFILDTEIVIEIDVIIITNAIAMTTSTIVIPLLFNNFLFIEILL